MDTACSSALAALSLAAALLRRDPAVSGALAGGSGTLLAPENSTNFSKAGMLSPDGRCKTFDSLANGYVRAEGCGWLLLDRTGIPFRRNGDSDSAFRRIAVTAAALNCDGRSNGLTAPSGPAQTALLDVATLQHLCSSATALARRWEIQSKWPPSAGQR